MEYSKKQINPLIEKYGIDPSKDKKFIEIIELFGNQTNYQIWAIKSIYTKVITMPELRQIKDWASQNSTEIKNLLKENIISYKTREEIRQLFSEFEGLKRIKIVKTAINKFNTDQRKMLTNYLLADMKNGLDAMHSRKMQTWNEISFQFLTLPLSKQENIINLSSAIDNIDFLLEHIQTALNASYDWNKEDMLSYMSRKASDCEVIFNQGEVVVIKVPSFKSSKTMCGNGRTGWCLTREERYFNQYVRDASDASQYFLFDFSKREDHELAHIGFTVRSGRGITNAHSTQNNNLLGDGISVNGRRINIYEALKLAKVPKGVYSPLRKFEYFKWSYESVMNYIRSRSNHFAVAYDKDGKVILRALTTEGLQMILHFSLLDNRIFSVNNQNYQYVFFDFTKQSIDDNACILFTYTSDPYGTLSLSTCRDVYNVNLTRDIFKVIEITEDQFLAQEKIESKILLHKHLDMGNQSAAIELLHEDADLDVNYIFNGTTAIFKAINSHQYNVVKAIVSHPKFDVNGKDNFGETSVQSLMYIYLTTSVAKERDVMKELILHIIDHGYNLNDTNINGDTVINCACEDVKFIWLVEKLISNREVDLNVVNDINCTALGNAIRKKNTSALELLSQRSDIVIRSSDLKRAEKHGIILSTYFDNLNERVVNDDESCADAWAEEFMQLLG